MAEATVDFGLGLETVTSVLEIDLVGSETILTGDIDAVVLAGTTARLRGNCRLLNNLHVRGTLTADPSGVVLDGQDLWDIHTHDGGVLNLAGVEKTAWCRWGDPVVGWEIGDRLAVAPTAQGDFTPSETQWTGDWASLVRPSGSSDVTLLDGRIARPEVANLSQTLTIQNVQRIMMHESGGVPNVHTLKWLKVLDSGKTGELGFYSIHFHLLGESARGSLVEGVVVEGAKFRSFVPHGSHGITFRDVVSYNATAESLWWDEPVTQNKIDESNDIVIDRLLALSTTQIGVAIALGAGQRNSCIDSAAAGGPKLGLFWIHLGRNIWELERLVVHNVNHSDGAVRAWQNDGGLHVSNDLDMYHCRVGLAHGAYNNAFQWNRLLIQGMTTLQGVATAVQQAALGKATGPVKYTDVLTDGMMVVSPHKGSPSAWLEFIRATFTGVKYSETTSTGDAGSKIRYIDCGLIPADFVFTKVHPTTLIEIVEGGVLLHSWAAGVWS